MACTVGLPDVALMETIDLTRLDHLREVRDAANGVVRSVSADLRSLREQRSHLETDLAALRDMPENGNRRGKSGTTPADQISALEADLDQVVSRFDVLTIRRDAASIDYHAASQLVAACEAYARKMGAL